MATRASFSDLELVNQALTSLGEGRISNLEEDTAPAIVMREHYVQVVEDTLTGSNWRFATAKASLNKLSDTPINRWAAGWQLPLDMLKLLYTWPASNYEIMGQRIYTNEQTELVVDYIRIVPEGEMPAWFRRLVVANLVMKTCKGITGDDPDRTMTLELERADNRALTADAQQQPNQTILPNDFIDVRH